MVANLLEEKARGSDHSEELIRNVAGTAYVGEIWISTALFITQTKEVQLALTRYSFAPIGQTQGLSDISLDGINSEKFRPPNDASS